MSPISLYESIDKARVMEELDALEGRVRDALCRTDEERTLCALSKNVSLLRNIFGITLTKDDYTYYKAHEGDFDIRTFVAFIRTYAPHDDLAAKLDEDAAKIDRYRREIARFYEYSLRRDGAFLENMRLAGPVVLVTGGFHTENLAALCKARGISYISIMPSFKNEKDYACPYFAILSGTKDLKLETMVPAVLREALAIPDRLSVEMRAAVDALPPGPGEARSVTAAHMPRIPAIGNFFALVAIYPHEFFHALADGFRGTVEIVRKDGRVLGGRYVAREGENFRHPVAVLMAAPVGMALAALALAGFVALGMPGISGLVSASPFALAAIKAAFLAVAGLYSFDAIVNLDISDETSDGGRVVAYSKAAANGERQGVREAHGFGFGMGMFLHQAQTLRQRQVQRLVQRQMQMQFGPSNFNTGMSDLDIFLYDHPEFQPYKETLQRICELSGHHLRAVLHHALPAIRGAIELADVEKDDETGETVVAIDKEELASSKEKLLAYAMPLVKTAWELGDDSAAALGDIAHAAYASHGHDRFMERLELAKFLWQKGFYPRRLLVNELENAPRGDRDAVVAGWQKLMADITEGRVPFDRTDPIQRRLMYTQYKNVARYSLKLDYQGFTYDSFRKLLRSRSGHGKGDAGRPGHDDAELIYAGYESLRLLQFIRGVRARAQELGREVIVVPNLSYGRFAVSPIAKELAAMGIAVEYARVGSTEAHDNPGLIKTDLFPKELISKILTEQPIIIVVDGTSHIVDRVEQGKSARYPDAHVGYLNFITAINDVICSSDDTRYRSLVNRSASFIRWLRKDLYFRILKDKIVRAALDSHITSAPPYGITYWNPEGRDLVLRQYREELGHAGAVDPRDIRGPTLVIANATMTDESIPDAVRALAGGQRHTPAFYDDDSVIQEVLFRFKDGKVTLSDELERAYAKAYRAVKKIAAPTSKKPARAAKEAPEARAAEGTAALLPLLEYRISRRWLEEEAAESDQAMPAVFTSGQTEPAAGQKKSREATTQAVIELIVERQTAYLKSGEERDLIHFGANDIARELSLDQSTISRILDTMTTIPYNGKEYPLSILVNKKTGYGYMRSRIILRQICREEKLAPGELSATKIMARFNELWTASEGSPLVRRTVAKYVGMFKEEEAAIAAMLADAIRLLEAAPVDRVALIRHMEARVTGVEKIREMLTLIKPVPREQRVELEMALRTAVAVKGLGDLSPSHLNVVVQLAPIEQANAAANATHRLEDKLMRQYNGVSASSIIGRGVEGSDIDGLAALISQAVKAMDGEQDPSRARTLLLLPAQQDTLEHCRKMLRLAMEEAGVMQHGVADPRIRVQFIDQGDMPDTVTQFELGVEILEHARELEKDAAAAPSQRLVELVATMVEGVAEGTVDPRAVINELFKGMLHIRKIDWRGIVEQRRSWEAVASAA